MRNKQFYTYILTNKRHTVLYIGITGSFQKRMWQHKNKYFKGFTTKYNVDQLVYFESYDRARDAIYREKQLKGWTRKKKEALIDSFNPDWEDLAYDLSLL